MVIQLIDTAGTGFAVLGFIGLEAVLVFDLPLFLLRQGCVGFADLAVNSHRRQLLHMVGHVGVNVQRSGSGDMTDDGGEGFYIHTVFQCHRGKGVPKLVEAENGDYGIITTKYMLQCYGKKLP